MARRRLIWHVGLPHAPRAVLPATLDAHAEALAAAGSPVVATAEQAQLATHELLRTHRSAGLTRAEVEGHWARIADRVWAHKGVSLLSTPDLASADKDQLRLALDPLIGVEVHLVVSADALSEQLYGAWLAELRAGRSTGWEKYAQRVLERAADGSSGHRQGEDFWAGHELASVLARWSWTIHADRIHVVLGGGPASAWGVLGEVAGVSGDLPVVVPPLADPAGVAVLRRVNRQLDGSLVDGSTDLLTRGEPEWGMPVVDTTAARPLLDRWAESLASGGYDVRGDVHDLVADVETVSLPGHRDQLSAAVDALSDALTENSRLRARTEELERDNARLDRKRRKHKRRLRELTAD